MVSSGDHLRLATQTAIVSALLPRANLSLAEAETFSYERVQPSLVTCVEQEQSSCGRAWGLPELSLGIQGPVFKCQHRCLVCKTQPCTKRSGIQLLYGPFPLQEFAVMPGCRLMS